MSAEFMIDCDTNDSGCSGGNLDDAWEFIKSTGLPTEECYPYRHYPGPPPPPPPPTCQWKANTDYAPLNASIMVVGIDSPGECCDKCGGTPACVLGVYQPPGLCHLKAKADIAGGAVERAGYVATQVLPPPPGPTCPKTCHDGVTPINSTNLFRASSAYAVGAPGDTDAMQRELMANGPFEVGFEVYSDFSAYKNGTYTHERTPAVAQWRSGV